MCVCVCVCACVRECEGVSVCVCVREVVREGMGERDRVGVNVCSEQASARECPKKILFSTDKPTNRTHYLIAADSCHRRIKRGIARTKIIHSLHELSNH